MADHAKLWLQSNLNQLAINRATEVMAQRGASLPCHVTAVSGSIVTVAFDVDSAPWTLPEITIPKAESPWYRQPTQIGDTGITIAADVYHGIISGMGGELPKIGVVPGNFSALIFLPVSNKNTPPSDQDAAIVSGPNGAVLETTVGTVSSVVTNQTGTTITFGGVTLVVNATGITGTIGTQHFSLTNAGFFINGLNFGTHHHTGVTIGSGNTGGPV